MSTGLGSRGCWREKASSRCVSDSARLAPRIALSAERRSRPAVRAVFAQVTLERFEISDDDGEKIIEVVSDAAGQLADPFHLLCLEQPFFGGAALGQVSRDLGKADDSSLRVPDRIDNHASPEPRPILADPPAFRLILAGAGSRLQCLLWNLALPVLVGIELREVLTDDLVARVALDPLGPWIPVDHRALGVEHVNRVIRDAFHENPEAVFDLLQFQAAGGKLLRALGRALFKRPVQLLQLVFRLLARRDLLLAGLVKT